jgi:Bacterial SH3 domain
MTYSHSSQSGYVYCVRRVGKTYYNLGSAPAGQFALHLQAMNQTEEDSSKLVLLGWVEVRDHELAVRLLRDAFHLYQLKDDWFDFRVARSRELKSLLGLFADLMVQWPVNERLIDQEPQPYYDRSFGFFEAIHQANQNGYFPNSDRESIDVFPTAQSSSNLLSIAPTHFNSWLEKIQKMPNWIYGLGGLAISVGCASMIAIQSSKPSAQVIAQPPIENKKTEPIHSAKPEILTSVTPKTIVPPAPQKNEPTQPKLKSKQTEPKQAEPPKAAHPMIWSSRTEGASIRSRPQGEAIDYLPNGTPLILGETAEGWQEIILPDGQRGWVFQELVKN